MRHPFLAFALALLLAPPVALAGGDLPPPAAGRALPPWLMDCAGQMIVRATMEEARARLKARGAVPSDDAIVPTPEDLERALARLDATLDDVMVLSGLEPRRPERLSRPVDNRPDRY